MNGFKVALVGSEHEENLSLRYLAASVEKAGFEAEIFAYDGVAGTARNAVVEAILKSKAQVVGISVPFQHRAQALLTLANDIRAAGYDGHVTSGGHFATFEYESILRDHPSVSSIVRHEGEDTLVELCQALQSGGSLAEIAGLVTRAPVQKSLPIAGRSSNQPLHVGPERPLPKLNSLPFPDRRGTPMQVLGVRTAPILGSRGCYADCSFCCIYAYADAAKGPRYRMRTVENIVEEMKSEYHRRHVRLFVFHDDNFFLPYAPKNIERYEQMAKLLREEGLTDIALVIKCRPNDVDPHLFRVLQNMGMIRAYIGIETNSDEGIVSLNRRITSEDNRRALQVFDEIGLYSSFNMLIFDPEATLHGVESNLNFMADHTHIPWNFCRAEVYAGTPLKATLESQKRLAGDYLAWNYQMRDERVELLFRIATTAFFGRNFKVDGVANLNMGIRFDAEVLKRFYPHTWTQDLGRRLVAMSREVGGTSIQFMREALAFARSVPLSDRRAIHTFTLDLTRRITKVDFALLGEVKSLRAELERRVNLPMPAGSSITGALPWAAETARLGTSVGLPISTEQLPMPALAT
ncbi:MAG: cobalamin-dependent protein [Polyangiaceae bacterium]|nr:cobalamin-dependent protein [Polyangiaceae bacterium]